MWILRVIWWKLRWTARPPAIRETRNDFERLRELGAAQGRDDAQAWAARSIRDAPQALSVLRALNEEFRPGIPDDTFVSFADDQEVVRRLPPSPIWVDERDGRIIGGKHLNAVLLDAGMPYFKPFEMSGEATRRRFAKAFEEGWSSAFHDSITRSARRVLLGMRKVLIVSHDAPIRLMCRVNLEPDGLHVVEAADGVECLEKVRGERPDVIFLAVMLTRLDGLSVAKELRDDPRTKEIPIVFNSARAEFCECVWELDLSDVDCLPLPFNPLELAAFLTDVFLAAKSRGTSNAGDLEDLWSLREVAMTPNYVGAPVARWRSSRRSARGSHESPAEGPNVH
jgi:CheY-like chemotaxis protein